jgi:regulator of protease activity HflC (stomatin/prohibitin superfamily)
VSSYPIVTGRVWYNPWSESVLSWPTFVQTAKWTASLDEGKAVNEEITFTNADQMQIAADISVSYHLVSEKVPAFYVKFRTDHMDQFTHGYMRNVARDMFDKHAGKYKIEQIMGDNAMFLQEVRAALERDVAPIGVVIDQFGLIGAPRPPKSVTDAINEKARAGQIAVQKQIELIQTQAEAAKEIAKAEGHASAVLKAAKADAEANRMLSESLTDKLIALKHLEKWNGAYPQVTGGATPLLQLK